MPSLTSLPLTARGPVSSLSTPILIGSFDVWARAADVSRRKARTTSPTRPVHRLTRFFASMLFPPASLVSGGGQDTGPVKAASTALVFGRRCGRTHTPAMKTRSGVGKRRRSGTALSKRPAPRDQRTLIASSDGWQKFSDTSTGSQIEFGAWHVHCYPCRDLRREDLPRADPHRCCCS